MLPEFFGRRVMPQAPPRHWRSSATRAYDRKFRLRRFRRPRWTSLLPSSSVPTLAARRSLSPGHGGTWYEHLKVLLEDDAGMELLTSACERIAQGNVPNQVAEAMRMSRLTALQKSNGKVRGVAAGCTFRRLVGKALSKQFQEQFRFAVAPANFGLCDRWGTDALVHLLRAASDADPDLAITCVDGVGAFDHVHRARIFEELLAHPVLRDLVPHVRMWYGTRSTFVWTDENGESHLVEQAEGGEQGDPLMPALFCLAVRPALQAAQGMLQSGEGVFAYLDDVYLLTRPERARDALDTVSRNLGESCGIAVDQGKLQSWSRSGGEAPAGLAALDTADHRVWRGSELPERNGVTIVGTPIGHTAFVDRTADEKLAEQGALATEVLRMPSTQSTWLLFLFCVVPRINHLLRTVPPAQAAGLASRH